MQYKQDGVGANGWNKIQSMNDSEFISHLGWLESDKKASPPQQPSSKANRPPIAVKKQPVFFGAPQTPTP